MASTISRDELAEYPSHDGCLGNWVGSLLEPTQTDSAVIRAELEEVARRESALATVGEIYQAERDADGYGFASVDVVWPA